MQSISTSPPRALPAGLTSSDATMLIVVVIWAGNISIVKAALTGLAPLPFTAVRFTLATVVLLILLRLREGAVRAPRVLWGRLLALGLVGNTAYQTFFILGLSKTTAANSAMLMGTTPAIVALTSGLLGLEKLTRQVVCGVALALAGIVVVMSQQGAAVSAKTLTGDLLTLCAALCWTAYVLGLRALGGRLSTLGTTAFTLLTGTPGMIVLGWPQLRAVRWAQLPAQVWFALAYSSLLALVVAYVLYNRNIKRIGGVRTAIYGCAIPLLATLLPGRCWANGRAGGTQWSAMRTPGSNGKQEKAVHLACAPTGARRTYPSTNANSATVST